MTCSRQRRSEAKKEDEGRKNRESDGRRERGSQTERQSDRTSRQSPGRGRRMRVIGRATWRTIDEMKEGDIYSKNARD